MMLVGILDYLLELVWRESEYSAPDRVLLLICLEHKLRRNGKSCSTAPDRPEQIAILAFRGSQDSSIGKNQFRAQQIVNRKSVASSEISKTAPEDKSTDAGVIDGPCPVSKRS
jgi:hypothetical protein